MPSLPPPAPGNHRIGGCVHLAPWDPGPVLLESCSQSHGSKGSRCRPLFPESPDPLASPQAGAPALYGDLPRCAALPYTTSSISDSRRLEVSLPILRFCPVSLLSTFPLGKKPVQIFKVPAYPGLGSPVLEALATLLSPASCGAPPPLDSYLFIYLFIFPPPS